jgi:N-acetylmuramoyl-L-alanine amidase
MTNEIRNLLCAALLCLAMTVTAVVTAVRGVRYYGDKSETAVADAPVVPFTLVIDAGHGGEDGGAVSPGGVVESEINLDIALRLDALMALFGHKPVMTRVSETLVYPESAVTTRARKAADQKSRLTRIRATPNALLVSIHQNKYTTPKPFGAQVLYAPTPHSEEIAKDMQSLLVSALNPRNYRTAEKISDSIYIMNNVTCPAILIECGFLSNPAEEALLRSERYRLKVASVIAAGVLRARDTMSGAERLT